MTAIDSIVARLTALHPKRIDLSLDRMWRILMALGDPQRRMPPTIHVAGTNGKGSTMAFMRAILEAAGLRVHVYTSPHLVRFNERFRLGAKGEGCFGAACFCTCELDCVSAGVVSDCRKKTTPQANSRRDGFNMNDMATLQETRADPATGI